MIQLIDRKTALQHQTLAAHVYSLQEMMYNPANDPDIKKTNAAFRKLKAEYQVLKDDNPAEIYELQGSYIYNLPTVPLAEYVKNLGSCLTAYAQYTSSPLTFILDYSIPWLSQTNDFEPVLEAMTHLRSIGIDDKYIGAIRVDGEELSAVVHAVFWLGRCNANLPYCWFVPEEQGIVGSICKHGNIHFDAYIPEEKEELASFITAQQLVEIDTCVDGFL
ncbi:MAG: hypothetical protein AAGJ93_11190 [Bacteroidota bacterium]